MHAALAHVLWRRKKRENKRNAKIQEEQAATNYFLECIFQKNKPKKEHQNRGKKNCTAWSRSRCEYQHDRTTPSTTPTNWRRGLLQKAVTTRDRCVAHMILRSCRDVRHPRHLPKAKTAAILQSHPDGTTKKQNIVRTYFGDPQTGQAY